MIKYTEDEKYITGRLMVVQEGIRVHAGHKAGKEVPGSLPLVPQSPPGAVADERR